MKFSLRRFAAAAACFVIAGTAHAAANVKITEFMYSGTGGEYIEFTNLGDASQDMTGWSFDDDSATPGSVDLSAYGTLQPGESAILTESSVADFRTAWNLCPAQKIIGGNSDNLGSADEINLYDNTNAQVDKLDYSSGANAKKGFGSFPATSAALGANDITQWQISAMGDVEHSYASTNGDVGSPGKSSLITSGQPACRGPVIRITEYMYDSSDGEFVEFTNVGDAPQDMTGWSFDDNHDVQGTVSLSGLGTLHAGESGIVTDQAPDTFRTAWGLCAGQKVVQNTSGTDTLGREDHINLWSLSSATPIDFLNYGDDTVGGPRAKGASAYPPLAALGANTAAQWVLSTVGDSESSYKTVDGLATGSPGKTTLATLAYDPCIGSAGSPTIETNGTTSPWLNMAVNGAGAASGVLDDPTDPASTIGIGFTIASGSATYDVSQLTVTATSSDTTVVPAANLVLTGSGATRQLTITPAAVGYSTITVLVSDPGHNEGAYVIDYGASAASTTPATTRFFTGTSDTSTGIAIDAGTMLVGDDENQALRLYSRDNSGWPLAAFDFTANLQLTDLDGGVPREVDIEASARAGSRIFWAGSHSNSDGGDLRPDRYRVFATDLTGSGANTQLVYTGRYDHLRDDMIAWDQGNANVLGFAASTAAGVGAKQASGFNIEGLAIAPDNSSAYVAFRAPLLPTDARTQALIVPVRNFDALVTGGGLNASLDAGSAQFGTPILLDLGGRGMREIVRNNAGQYLIIAGPPGDDNGVPPTDFRLFTWTGNPNDKPIELSFDLTSLQPGGSWESIVGFSDTIGSATPLQLLVDNGDTVWYADGVSAKSLVAKQLAKFRGDRVMVNIPLASDVIFLDGFESR